MQVKIPASFETERRYIVKVLLDDFLGLNYDLEVDDQLNVTKICSEQKVLEVVDSFFAQAKNCWLLPSSLPSLPLKNLNIDEVFPELELVSSSVPVIYGEQFDQSTFFKYSDNSLALGVDVFGSSFFMLSRYEELVVREKDNHDRFPASASVAYKENFLGRPIINEYLEVLWASLTKLWPGLKRKPRSSSLFLTHDVDRPFYHLYRSSMQATVSFAGDILKRRSYSRARERFGDWASVRSGNYSRDPFYSFKYIMDTSEHRGIRSAFYFLAGRSGESVDADYDLRNKPIQNLLSNINERGHEIGLHGSYYSYKSQEILLKEKNNLQSTLQSLGITQKVRGSRQHYLRWDSSITPSMLDALDVEYDTTLSYADYAGFRCGVCYSFPIFDLKNRKALNTYERPLIMMECSVMDSRYMGYVDPTEALGFILKLYDNCRRFRGDFVILWHNSQLCTREEREIYEQIISY